MGRFHLEAFSAYRHINRSANPFVEDFYNFASCAVWQTDHPPRCGSPKGHWGGFAAYQARTAALCCTSEHESVKAKLLRNPHQSCVFGLPFR